MKEKIIITPVTIISDKCEYGCWNKASGFHVEIAGKFRKDLTPFATCTDSYSFDSESLYNFIVMMTGFTTMDEVEKHFDIEWTDPKEI